MSHVFQSINIVYPICKVTATIIATEAMFTASRNADAIFDLRNFGTNGLSNKTKINDGRNIPTVATIAPIIPSI